MRKKLLGKLGEELAAEKLQAENYRVLERNFSSKFGEIDIIALEGQDLVFVEVKTRWGKAFGLPEEAVTPAKIHHLKRTGFYYKSLHPELPESLRIDVVAITLSSQGKLKTIRLFRNITG